MDKTPLINRQVVMAKTTEQFSVVELNTYSHEYIQPDKNEAQRELDSIKETLADEGVKVHEYDVPKGCQDGIYVANEAVCFGSIAVAGRLPGPRQAEMLPFREYLHRELGKTVLVPPWQRFSGQGDALRFGDILFVGHGYRSDKEIVDYLSDNYREPSRRRLQQHGVYNNVVSLQTIPLEDEYGNPKRNELSGWWDSPFYDIDLAIGVVRPPTKDEPGILAWCPEALTLNSQLKIIELAQRHNFTLVEVSLAEAKDNLACNLVSTGHAVIMTDQAPELQAKLEKFDNLRVYPKKVSELKKGGGGPRCVTLEVTDDVAEC